jgi:hypothetical protein
MVLWEYVKGSLLCLFVDFCLTVKAHETLIGSVTGQPAVPHNVRELGEDETGAARKVGKM